MMRWLLTCLVFGAVALGLSACGSRPKSLQEELQGFDVRKAVVMAAAGVPLRTIEGVQRRLDHAIAVTNRSGARPRVVINIRITDVRKGLGTRRGRAEADLAVTVSSVDSGEAFREIGFRVYSFTLDPASADDAMAEAIASRIRYMFTLVAPPIVEPAVTMPRLSTRMAGEDAAAAPLVVPASAVRRIGADADPVLNSKTVIEPATTDKARVEPALKATKAPVSIDDGAAATVTIKPKADQPASALETTSDDPTDSGEPCVETVDTTCPAN